MSRTRTSRRATTRTCESLGIKPQLNRSLGFLANFALAFSFISVSTGSFGNFGVGFGLGGPVMFWTWLIIVAGQFIVALGFAELASHYPVAGSIYQWSKRLSHRTLGWFTGWFYFWAQVVTVTAVACIVAFVVDGIMGQADFLASPSPLGVSDMFTFIAITTLVITTLINAFGVRLVATLNNIGVATEILGMLVFALILLFFANHQSPDVLTQTFGAEAAQNGNMFATFALAFFMSIFILYGFDTAGTFGEETIDASRQAPRGVLSSVLISGAVGVVFLLAIILSLEDIPATMAAGLAGEFPIATTITANLSTELVGGITVGEIYLFVILASVFVCTLAIQGAATRMMFSMGRDGNLPWQPGVGPRQHPLPDPGQRRDRRRRPRRHPDPAGRSDRRHHAVDRGDRAHLPELLPVQPRPPGRTLARLAAPEGLVQPRPVGHADQHPGAHLGRDHARQHRPVGVARSCSATSAARVARYWNPLINGLFSIGGQKLEGLPAWPLFETLVGLLLVVGAIYYVIAVRGRAVEIEADAVTGEGVIG